MNPASFAFAAQHLYQFLNTDGLPVVFNKLKLFHVHQGKLDAVYQLVQMTV